ncbi:VWA domain-containing protein [Streptomyces tauricus]|uniref:VWA domain-containing protein n=1 Tax=Streptomyces tauricus TaxID=68274 RepID=A0ABZ1JEL3_9ACTN|nr:VWA domain-containing protein [Streptomyces tauricus]MCW8095357.1 VWA domain-containing protein [Streptomyces tauricus]
MSTTGAVSAGAADRDARTEATDRTEGAEVTDPAGGTDERLRRWRLVLGGEDADGTGCALTGQDAAMDGTLGALYGNGKGGRARAGQERSAGLGASAPAVARWLGDIRTYFPSSVVQVMQRDAIDRLGLSTLLLEPEMLEAVEADVHLVGTLLSLNKAMPETTKETARAVVRKVVEDLEKRLATRTRATLTGALDRSARISRPRHQDIDWNRTIAVNLKHYLPEYRTIVPERLIGYGRASQSVKKEVVLCIDQSGSMAASVVYASVFGAVLASMRSIDTRLVVFDTAVVDLTDQLDDPVDVLFGTQLGGGTDINRALAYCQSQITRPADTVVVLISDLYEGGIRNEMLKRVAAMKASGVQFVTLLALSDEGAPAYDREHAAALAGLGAPAFACTPDLFPEVMAAAIEKRPLPIPDTGSPAR